MAERTYSKAITNAEVMFAGLETHAEQVAKRGLDVGFIQKMNNDLRAVVKLNNEQEALKSELKQKTADLDAKMSELKAAVSQARKLVKMDFPKEQWTAFGIEDKR
jgi:hypothetical protein